jgi:hypothetical protein
MAAEIKEISRFTLCVLCHFTLTSAGCQLIYNAYLRHKYSDPNARNYISKNPGVGMEVGIGLMAILYSILFSVRELR